MDLAAQSTHGDSSRATDWVEANDSIRVQPQMKPATKASTAMDPMAAWYAARSLGERSSARVVSTCSHLFHKGPCSKSSSRVLIAKLRGYIENLLRVSRSLDSLADPTYLSRGAALDRSRMLCPACISARKPRRPNSNSKAKDDKDKCHASDNVAFPSAGEPLHGCPSRLLKNCMLRVRCIRGRFIIRQRYCTRWLL